MFDINKTFIFIGIVIVIFIICVGLLIFAPRSINFHDATIYPILKYINENNSDIIHADFDKIENAPWIDWPDKDFVKGNVTIYPIFMFSILSEKRKNECINTFNLIQNIPDIKTCAFLKIDKTSRIQKHAQYKGLNNTLRCIIILKSVSTTTIDQCGIWVNGESKKIKSKNIYIYDSSKEHSIYNETDYPVYAFMIDIKRPEKIPDGISEREYDDNLYDFINTLTIET